MAVQFKLEALVEFQLTSVSSSGMITGDAAKKTASVPVHVDESVCPRIVKSIVEPLLLQSILVKNMAKGTAFWDVSF
jgi:hypothetical protein